MVDSVGAVAKIVAASYAHNQTYHTQSALWSSVFPRLFPKVGKVYRSIQNAASGLLTLLKLAGNLQASSEQLQGQTREDDLITVKQLQQLVGDYNQLLAGLSEAGVYVNPWLRRSLESSVSGFESIGIRKQADGSLQLDETQFLQSLHARPPYTRNSISGAFGLADGLGKASGRIQSMPPSALLNAKSLTLQQYAVYQPTRSYYWQMPVSGLLYDRSF